MNATIQTSPIFVTSTIRSGDLHHRLLIHPEMQAMVVIPTTLYDHPKATYPENLFADQLSMYLMDQGISCLLTEIVTSREDADHRYRMDEELHACRLLFALNQAELQCNIPRQPTGLAGMGARGVCCLLAARRFPDRIQAVANVDLPPGEQRRFAEQLCIPVRFEHPEAHNHNPIMGRTTYPDCARQLAFWFRTHLKKNTTKHVPEARTSSSFVS